MMYFSSPENHKKNTIAVTTATRKAGTQDEKVMTLFNMKPGIKATASQVFAGGVKGKFWTERTPLTSIRRSMSSLTKEGQLIKLDETRMGIFGKLECYYSLPAPAPVNAE